MTGVQTCALPISTITVNIVNPISTSITSPSDNSYYQTIDTITFNSTVSGGYGAQIFSWKDNGVEFATTQNATYTITTTGSHTITFTATDSLNTDTSTIIINIVTTISTSITSPSNSSYYSTTNTINFNGTASDGYGSQIYSWKDNGVEFATTQNTTHTITTSGSHTITFTATDSLNTDTSTIIINIVTTISTSITSPSNRDRKSVV